MDQLYGVTQQGFMARMACVPRDANPYSPGQPLVVSSPRFAQLSLEARWEFGWQTADKESSAPVMPALTL